MTPRLDVVIVTPEFGVGGEEYRSLRIAEGLAQAGLHVRVVTDSGHESEIRRLLPCSIRTAGIIGLASRASILPSVFRLRRLLEEDTPRCVLLFKRRGAFLGWFLEFLGLRRRCVFNVANDWPDGFWLRWFFPHRLVLLSDRLASWAAGRRDVHTIPLGIRVDRFTEAGSTSRTLAVSPLRVLMVGGVGFQKNHGLALDVSEALVRRGIEHRIRIAGAGPDLARLQASAAARKLDVEFLGAQDDVSRLLGQCDVVLFTSRYEGLPNALLEAGAAGRIVIAPAVGAIPDVLGADNGYLVSGTLESFVEAFEQVLAAPEEARVRAERLRLIVLREHTEERMLRAYVEYISACY
jgi:glycosyltransferase involved in cell wall biosynthesis